MSGKAVEARGIALAYGPRMVLVDLSLDIGAGEFFIIIGPNGAGKSTLLRALAATVAIDAGRIRIFGRPQESFSRREYARTAALVSQDLAIDFPFTVADTVLMGRSPHMGLLGLEKKEDHTIAHEAMAATNTLHLAGRTLNQLSGGERQRVIIARAICQQPRLLFLDEPTAALDLAHQIRIMDLLERLRQDKEITICMISHDINLAAMYASRLLLLHQGRIAALGAPSDVLRRELLEKSYACPLLVDDNPLCASRRVLPVPEQYAAMLPPRNGN